MAAPDAGMPGRASPRVLTPDEWERVPHLTEREWQVMRAVGRGLQNKEIAEELGISAQTVKNHQRIVNIKLDVANRIEALAALGWLEVPER